MVTLSTLLFEKNYSRQIINAIMKAGFANGNSFGFLRIDLYRICRRLFLVIVIFKTSKNSFYKLYRFYRIQFGKFKWVGSKMLSIVFFLYDLMTQEAKFQYEIF